MKVFISYATEDLDKFRVKDIAESLERTEKISKVFYWDRDNIVNQSRGKS